MAPIFEKLFTLLSLTLADEAKRYQAIHKVGGFFVKKHEGEPAFWQTGLIPQYSKLALLSGNLVNAI